MISETLRLLRVINGFKAKDLAVSLDISPSFLSEIETGKKEPSLALLNKYAEIFEIKLSTLFLFTEDNENSAKTSNGAIKTRDTLFKFMKYIESVEQTS